MIVNRLESRPAAAAISRKRTPGRNRFFRFIVLTFGSGLGAALFAILIAGLPTVVAIVIPPQAPAQLQAGQLFPPVPPVHKTIVINDPPVYRAPAPAPAPAPRPPATAAPTQPPGSDDGGGGGPDN